MALFVCLSSICFLFACLFLICECKDKAKPFTQTVNIYVQQSVKYAAEIKFQHTHCLIRWLKAGWKVENGEMSLQEGRESAEDWQSFVQVTTAPEAVKTSLNDVCVEIWADYLSVSEHTVSRCC